MKEWCSSQVTSHAQAFDNTGKHTTCHFHPSGWRCSGRDITILIEPNERVARWCAPQRPCLPADRACRSGLKVFVGHLRRCADQTAHTFSVQNQRDEEQRQPVIMRSRLPRTACLLRLIALCILLSHTAAYFGSAYLALISSLLFNRLHHLLQYTQRKGNEWTSKASLRPQITHT